MSLSFALRHLRYLRQSGVVGRCAFAVVAATCLSLLFPAQGVTASGTAPTQRVQATGEAQVFDIPAGPLAASLNALSRAAGLTLAVDPTEVAGKTAPAVSGTFTSRQALERLLAGSGLRHRFTNSTTVTLEPVAARQNDGTLRLGPVMVEGELDPLAPPATGTIGSPPPAFPGGQVATGQQLGLLGNRDRLETPLSTTSVTSNLIRNLQATDHYAVVQLLPSVQVRSTPTQGGVFIESRGVIVERSALAFNGVTSLFHDTVPSLLGIERIESVRGPTALFSGVTTSFGSTAGGTLNFVPRRAGSEDINRLVLGYQSDLIGFTQFDLERRFGGNQKWGLYLGGELLDGETPSNFSERFQGTAAAAIDYDSEEFRVSLDLRYTETKSNGQVREILGATGPNIPSNFDTNINTNQPWSFLNANTFISSLRLEYDVASETTVFGSASYAKHETIGLTAFNLDLQPNGDFRSEIVDFDDSLENQNLELGIRSQFYTGSIRHDFVAGLNYGRNTRRLGSFGFQSSESFTNNLFDPVIVSDPGQRAVSPDNDTGKDIYYGATVVNTFGFFDDRLQVTAGLRYQDISIESFSATTGDRIALSEGSKLSPGVGVLFRVNDSLSVYANYLEGLSNGGTAPLTAANPGEQLGPIVSDSIEVGAKFNIGTIGVDAALFQIRDITNGVDQNTNVFDEVGERRIRGLEITAFGEVIEDLRLLGGATFYDSEITESGDPANIGEDGLGTPDYVLTLGLEYDVPLFDGLTLTGGVRHQGEAKVAFGSDAEIPAWTTVDLGARYSVDRYTARFGVENLFDEAYFNGSSSGELALGLPRTFLASVSADF